MKYNVKFAPEKRNDKTGQPIVKNVPIFAGITFANTRLFYFTGFRLDVDKFDPEKQEAKKNSVGTEGTKKAQYNVINARFKAIRAALELFFQSTEKASKSDVISLLDETCKKAKHETPEIVEPEKIIPDAPLLPDFYTMFAKYQKEAKVSANRLKHATSVLNRWKKFEKKHNVQLSFENVNSDLLRKFEKYLSHEGVGKNTIHAILKYTRTVWNYTRNQMTRQGIEIPYPFGNNGYQVPGEAYGKPIYITSAERDQIYNTSLTLERLQHVRDVFIFQCFIGARVGDMCSLTKSNVQNGMLTYIPSKTAKKEPTPVNVPLSKTALEILSRYDLPGGKLLPFISDQRYNEYLKELFEVAGLTRSVTRQNPTTGKQEQVRLCDIASSHMARRAFVGNLYGKVDSGIIASMSGHVANSRAFARYYKVDEELQKQAISLL
jgi:integrase